MVQEKIIRGSGTTSSERRLAELAERTFLNLWSYPNLFIDRKQTEKGVGKELCDLLILCGNDVLIFSDKEISWPETSDYKLAWSRWYRNAIKKSVKQICGAERWLRKFPQRIFLDEKCNKQFPIELASLNNKRIHGVVIAKGASEACKKAYGDSSGTFPIISSIKGDAHTASEGLQYPPFAIGDVNPDAFFIHVFDGEAIELLLQEFDTITDFTEYLVKRENFLRSKPGVVATGEEDLMAFYIQNIMRFGHADFLPPSLTPITENTLIQIAPGEFSGLINTPEFLAKKSADKISYKWDFLINLFTGNVLGGTSVSLFDEPPKAVEAEKALRFLALENRYHRRLLGESLVDAMEKAAAGKHPRFSRIIMRPEKELAYVILILAYPTHLELKDGYEQYRKVRAYMLRTYCFGTLFDHRNIKTVVGIALDASPEVTGREGSSEDIMAVEVPEWTKKLEEQLMQDRKNFDVLKPENLKAYSLRSQEYPEM